LVRRPTASGFCADVRSARFVKRDVSRLYLERIDTQLTFGWVTTVEQTLLDLASRPTLGDLGRSDVSDAVKALATRADWNLLRSCQRINTSPRLSERPQELSGRRRGR